MKERIHKKICTHLDKVNEWYSMSCSNSYLPFYSSFDIRDAGFKIGNIDGNIFPAGFNNICRVDKEGAPELAEKFLTERFPGCKKILLLAEDHFKNLYYWENIHSLKMMLNDAGYEVQAGMLAEGAKEIQHITSFQGHEVPVEHIYSEDGKLRSQSMEPDLVISNNDFSFAYPDVDFTNTKIVPARELGWYQRKKSDFFIHYNQYVTEFCEIIDENPFSMQVQTELFTDFDVSEESSRQELAKRVDAFLGDLKSNYQAHSIKEEPFVVIKNNAGTYGLAVTKVRSGEEVLGWNYKSKKKMKAAKGGRSVSDVILQEGLPTVLTTDSATAEPAIYMVGCQLAGGFLRTHAKKDAQESLNSPGAVYKRLCLSDLRVQVNENLLENVYGCVARLGLLAISKEAEAWGLNQKT